MMSLEEMKKSLGEEAKKYSDEELIKIRDELYQWADLAFDTWLEEMKNKHFEHKADEKYFADLLARGSSKELKKTFFHLFDFRDPLIKRKEFNAMQKKMLFRLVELHGKKCMLGLLSDCEKNKNLVVDHFIPLSSNKLNKELRRLKPDKGKKVKTQSFGSNDIDNLVLACSKCNNYKKHKIPDRALCKKIMTIKLNVNLQKAK